MTRVIELTDEQVHSLNTDSDVKHYRSIYLDALLTSFKNPSLETETIRDTANAEYLRIFNEKMTDIINNPPTPKSEPLRRWNGFK